MAGAVRASGFRGSLVEFAEAVAEEAGPGADPSYWWKALLAAELEGLVFRSSCGFVPADSEPGGPICPPEEETPVPASVTAPAPVKPAAVSPPPVTVPASRPADDDKVAQFLAAADTMTRAAAAIKEALRKRAAARDQLADARQTLAAAQAAVDRLEAELINLDAAVDAARAAVNLDALLAIA